MRTITVGERVQACQEIVYGNATIERGERGVVVDVGTIPEVGYGVDVRWDRWHDNLTFYDNCTLINEEDLHCLTREPLVAWVPRPKPAAVLSLSQRVLLHPVTMALNWAVTIGVYVTPWPLAKAVAHSFAALFFLTL
jgi:hypothetical protein